MPALGYLSVGGLPNDADQISKALDGATAAG
jgi:hypothetical protein